MYRLPNLHGHSRILNEQLVSFGSPMDNDISKFVQQPKPIIVQQFAEFFVLREKDIVDDANRIHVIHSALSNQYPPHLVGKVIIVLCQRVGNVSLLKQFLRSVVLQ